MRKIIIEGKKIGQIQVGSQVAGTHPLKYNCICCCGEKFIADSQGIRSEKIDCGCGAVSGIRSKKFEVGEIYFGSEILSVEKYKNGKQTQYEYLCGCGKKDVRVHSDFLKHPKCNECLKKDRQKQAQFDIEKEFFGKKINGLIYTGFAGFVGAQNNAFVKVLCPKCGNEFEIRATLYRKGTISECSDCSKKNLQIGHEIIKDAAVDGTVIISIDGRRKKNVNNTSGANGVSFVPRNGKYRAYINFKRKQYYLGLYDKMEDAIAARKEAERHIYGEFIEWYSKEYPEKWEKIKKKHK